MRGIALRTVCFALYGLLLVQNHIKKSYFSHDMSNALRGSNVTSTVHSTQAHSVHDAAHLSVCVNDVYNAGRQYSAVDRNGRRSPRHWSFTVRSHERWTTLFTCMLHIHSVMYHYVIMELVHMG